MKKLFSRLLPAVLGLMLMSATTAFAQVDPDAKAVFDEMEAKSTLVSDANMFCRMDMMMALGSDTMQMSMDMNMLLKNMDQPDQMEFLCKYIMSAEGEQMPAVMWYKDGYSYADIAGQKMKMKSDVSDTVNAALILQSTMGSSSDLLSDLYLTQENGNRILNFTMDNSKLNEYVKQILTMMGMEQALTDMGVQINIHNISGTYTLTPDNNYSSATISMYMDMSMFGETIPFAMEGVIDMQALDPAVEIVYPSSEGFIDAGASMNAA